MAYDLEEQEQLDEFKAWWKVNGKIITSLVIVLVVGYLAFQGWKYYQASQAMAASTQYQELLVTEEKDLKAIQAKSAILMDKYASTPYAARAAVYAARINYQANEVKSAKAQLDWSIHHAEETSVSAIATLQLANILVDEKDFEGALKLVNAPHDAGFDGLFADLKGDILVSLGKNADAKVAYQLALAKLDPQGKYRIFTQHKLESLG